MNRTALLVVLSALWACGRAGLAGESQDWWGRFADATEVSAQRVEEWNRADRTRLAGKKLFDPANPLRLLRNTAAAPPKTGPHVEFPGGDVLPGLVTGCAPAARCPGQPLCLTVAPPAPLRAPYRARGVIYVLLDRVRRVVLIPPARGPCRPGMLFLADGSVLAAQAVRWNPTGLSALTGQGVRRLTFDELAEIHPPRPAPAPGERIRDLAREATAPAPRADSLIGRMTFSSGATVTCRLAGLAPAGHWDSRDPRLRLHPTWAAYGFEIPLKDLCLLNCWRADEAPLSLLPIETVFQHSFTGFVWTWRPNSSVRGETLATGALWSNLGLGTHSHSAIAVTLPTGARELQFDVGLDRTVGTGGCVKLKICQDSPEGKVLWQSGFLRGSNKPRHVGRLPCAKARRVVLVTEFGHTSRPRRADPGDVRDEVDWIHPTVRLEPGAMAALAGDPYRHFPGLAEWSPSPPPAEGQTIAAVWNTDLWRWEPVLPVAPEAMAFTRKVRVNRAAAVVTVSTRSLDAPAVVRLLADGQPLQAVDGGRDLETSRSPRTKTWSLLDHLGRNVDLTLQVEPKERRRRDVQLVGLSVQLHGVPAALSSRGGFTWAPHAIAEFDRRGKARLDPAGTMHLEDGAYIAPLLVSRAIGNACRRSNQLTLEIALSPANKTQGGPARIVSYSYDGSRRNFTLGQEGKYYQLRLRTTKTGENGTSPETRLGPVGAGARGGGPEHILITYQPGELAWYVNGRQAGKSAAVKGDFSNWDPGQRLLLGDEYNERRYWQGRIYEMYILARALSKKEALQRHRDFRARFRAAGP